MLTWRDAVCSVLVCQEWTVVDRKCLISLRVALTHLLFSYCRYYKRREGYYNMHNGWIEQNEEELRVADAVHIQDGSTRASLCENITTVALGAILGLKTSGGHGSRRKSGGVRSANDRVGPTSETNWSDWWSDLFWQHDRYGETYSAVGLGVRLAVDVERVAVSHTVRYQIYILWQDIASSQMVH